MHAGEPGVSDGFLSHDPSRGLHCAGHTEKRVRQGIALTTRPSLTNMDRRGTLLFLSVACLAFTLSTVSLVATLSHGERWEVSSEYWSLNGKVPLGQLDPRLRAPDRSLSSRTQVVSL